MRMGPFVFVCSVSQDVERDASTCMASYAKIARIDHSSEPAMTDQHQDSVLAHSLGLHVS